MSESEIISLQKRVKTTLLVLDAKNNNLFFRLFFRKRLEFLRHELANLFQILLMRLELADLSSEKLDRLIKDLNTVVPGYVCQVQIPERKN